MNFDFITDEKFRTILTRDHEELTKCLDIKASKSVLILAGSIIESILIEYFVSFPPEGVVSEKFLSMDLHALVNLAKDSGLISQSSKDLSTVIRNYRNLIHPGREIRKNEKFDYDSAVVAKSLLNIILKEVRGNYVNNIGGKATDIISKLESDSISTSVFEKIISKLHKQEKKNLYNLLVEYDLKRDVFETVGSKLTNPKKYLNTLKPHVEREIIIKQLLRLVNKIETGEKWEVMTLFYILHEDLLFLDENNIEFILLYVINVFTQATGDAQELERYNDQRLLSPIGKFNMTEALEIEVLTLFKRIIVSYKNSEYVYFSSYDQLLFYFEKENKEKLIEKINAGTSAYFTEQFYKSKEEYLPF